MPPPPAEQFASRIFLGPALRTQSDRRLVTLVRDGYETAFEEIVRRYRKPLDRFAASIVGGHSEDVTQDAFSKALLALRGSETEIELRPWLYRIVRNTALNNLRDRPAAAAELAAGTIGVGPSAADEAESREEMSDLMGRLRALPEPQRAAIVMRELEGLGHEEIAAALGVSGGAARQAIHRARTSLRDGFGMLVPLPLLRTLFDHGTEAAAGGTLATSAAGGSAAVFGGLGAGGALKLGAATVLIAGTLGAGVAIQRHDGGGSAAAAAASTQPPADEDSSSGHAAGGGESATFETHRSSRSGGGESRRGSSHGGTSNSGHGSSGGPDSHGGSSSPSPGNGSSGDGSSGHAGSGSGGSRSGHDDSSGGGHSGSGGGGSGRGGSGSSDSGGSDSGTSDSGSGNGSGSNSGSGSDGSDGSGSDDVTPPVTEAAPESGSDGSGSGSGGSGSSLDGGS